MSAPPEAVRRLSVAVIGSRGVPARYGGFETLAEELGKRLAARGHRVCVYGRGGRPPRGSEAVPGVRSIRLPALRISFLETLSHTFLALCHAWFQKFDVWLVLNHANSPLLVFPRWLKRPLALHMDGLEWKRAKWSALGRLYYRRAERLAAGLKIPLISDSREIRRYLKRTYGRDSVYIAYGAEIRESRDPTPLAELGLEPRAYFLMITRFEPENNPLLVAEAFLSLDTDLKLVLVGGSRYPSRYIEQLKKTTGPRVLFPGLIYHPGRKTALLSNCLAYIHGNEVGGTNPALLEAMAAGCFVIARDVKFNREVLRDAGLYFSKDAADLRERLLWALRHRERLEENREKARDVIRESYSWEGVVRDYERLFVKIAGKR